MSLTDALDLVSHPRRWSLFLRVPAPTPTRSGVLNRLTAEQKAKLFAFRGPEASGDQSLPKVQR
jgi:hypothetical protein